MAKKKSEAPFLNKKIPAFKAKNSLGEMVSSSDFKGKKVVLYFYPKDDTPGCTTEGQEFDELKKEFGKQNAVIFGVSRDSVKSHDKFKCKYGFGFELLSDEDEKLCKIFDVIKEKNMYGRKYMGVERSTFVLDENQTVIAEYRKVKAPGHAAQVLKDLKGK